MRSQCGEVSGLPPACFTIAFEASSIVGRDAKRRPALRRRKKINGWPLRDNSRRVDRAMAAVIVRLDLVEPHRLRYAWNLVQGSRVIPKLGEIGQATAITFEVTVIDGVKANERRKQTPVRFGDAVAYQERTARKPVLKSV